MSYNQDTQTYEFYSKVELPTSETEENNTRKNKASQQEPNKVNFYL